MYATHVCTVTDMCHVRYTLSQTCHSYSCHKHVTRTPLTDMSLSSIPCHKHVTRTPLTDMSLSSIPCHKHVTRTPLPKNIRTCADFGAFSRLCVRASYREQCSLLTIKTLFLLLLQLIQKYFQLHEIDNHSIALLCIIFTSPSLCVFVFAFVLCTCTFLPFFSDAI